MIFKDQIHNELILDDYPKRIISLVPSQTELLVDLGLEENIVGITKFCVHPKNLLKEKTIVGGTKKVNYRKVSNLKPDLIIGNKEENTEEMINEFDEIAPVYISNIITIEDLRTFILDIGKICNRKKESTQLIHEIDKGLDNFVEFVKIIHRNTCNTAQGGSIGEAWSQCMTGPGLNTAIWMKPATVLRNDLHVDATSHILIQKCSFS